LRRYELRDDVLLRRKELLDPPPQICGTRGDEPGEPVDTATKA